jgi:hypothetical protein
MIRAGAIKAEMAGRPSCAGAAPKPPTPRRGRLDPVGMASGSSGRGEGGRQIHTSFSAVRSPPSCPVLRTPRGSMSSSLTSFSA